MFELEKVSYINYENWKDMSEFKKSYSDDKTQKKKQEYDKFMSTYNKQKQDDK